MKHILYIVIIGLLVLISLQRECTRPPIPQPCPTIDTTYVVDTIKVHDIDTVYKPTVIYRDTGNTIYIPANIDSLAVAMAYFSSNVTIDTLVNDSTASIIIRDTVRKNTIVSRELLRFFIYRNTKYIIKTEHVTTPNRCKVFLGGGVRGPVSPQTSYTFGVPLSLAVMTKRDNLYTLDYDPINGVIGGTVYFKIRFRKE